MKPVAIKRYCKEQKHFGNGTISNGEFGDDSFPFLFTKGDRYALLFCDSNEAVLSGAVAMLQQGERQYDQKTEILNYSRYEVILSFELH